MSQNHSYFIQVAAACILSFTALTGCSSFSSNKGLTKDERALVGEWLFTDNDICQFYKMRHADKTFKEYCFQVMDDYTGTAITTTVTGTWRLRGKTYCETYTSVGYDKWQSFVGRPISYRCSRTAATLEYLFQDSMPVLERKISPSEAGVLAAHPFAFITAGARKKYHIEGH